MMRKFFSFILLFIFILPEFLLVYNRSNSSHDMEKDSMLMLYNTVVSLDSIETSTKTDTFLPEMSILDTILNDECPTYTKDNVISDILHYNGVRYEIRYLDTLYADNNGSYVHFCDNMYKTHFILYNNQIILENPSLAIHKVNLNENSKYYFETPFTQRLVDFTNPDAINSIRTFTNPSTSYSRYNKDYRMSFSHKGQCTFCSLTMDLPYDSLAKAENIINWLTELALESYIESENLENLLSRMNMLLEDTLIRKSSYKKCVFESLGKINSEQYFSSKRLEYPHEYDAPTYLISVTDLRGVFNTERFVTYQHYYFDYNGGAHGMYSSKLLSFDFIHKEKIDCKYLFKEECLDSIKHVVIDEAYNSDLFRLKSNVKTKQNTYYMFTKNEEQSNNVLNMNLPCPGLCEEGVVFSYPPYAIDCYASGCYHFIIPYKRIWPYLSDKGKWCVNKEIN